MIVLKYQESTTEKFFENAWTNLSFWGWGGGNRYVEGEPRIFGYLMLDDALGYPYFRLFNGNP